MASTTTRKARGAAAAIKQGTHLLDAFHDEVVRVVGVVVRTETEAILAKVLFGGTLAAMYDAVDDDTEPVKADAPKKEHNARRDGIRAKVLDYVSKTTGRFYSWSSVQAWVDAARVNATLPDHVQTRLNADDTIDGVFGVWPLRDLGRIEDEAIRATTAEKLAAEGITTQDSVRDAVDEVLGEKPEPLTPVAASAMIDALVKRYGKREAVQAGKVAHVMGGVDEDDAALLASFGRTLWTLTPTDRAIEDPKRRAAKRLEVFNGAVEQILFAGAAADDDGIDDAEAKQ